jgi:small-conductance mechanosensitive channel
MSYLIFSILSVVVLAPVVGLDAASALTIGAGLVTIAVSWSRCEDQRR